MNSQFTISQYRENIQTAARLLENSRRPGVQDENEYKISEEVRNAIAKLLFDYNYDLAVTEANEATQIGGRRARITFRARGPLTEIQYPWTGLATSDINNHQEAIDALKSNKLNYMVWRAYTSKINSYHMTVRDSEIYWETYANVNVEASVEDYEKSFYSAAEAIIQTLQHAFTPGLDHNDINLARRRYQGLLDSVQDRIDYSRRNETEATKNENKQKFVNVLGSAEIADASVIEEQLLATYELLPGNGLVARTWGFEVEVPDAKSVDAPAGVEKGEDGSLRSYESNSDCECECDGCTYHDCDCDYCDSRREGDEHCGGGYCATCDSAEYRTTGGLQRIISPALYKLCKDLNDADAEKNDTAGTHIHVYAKDLTTNQIGQVLAAYKRLEPLMATICGRQDVNYARNIPIEYIRAALKKRGATISTDKPRAINTGHLTNSRGTIEFRQMDCNLDANRMTVWAWICRAFVTSAKRGMKFTDTLAVTDLVSLIEMFAKYQVLLHDENPEQIVYGSKTDAGQFIQQIHQVG